MTDKIDDGTDDADHIESLIPYEEWMIDGMRRIMYLAIWRVSEQGLPGEHHYFVTFNTLYPGVSISANLQARFPNEMCIAIQHQFSALDVNENQFSITLQFGGVPETLVIPFRAISQFVDPSVHFSLDFEVDIEEGSAPETSSPRLVTTEGNVAHIATKAKPTAQRKKQIPTPAEAASSAGPPSGKDGSHDQPPAPNIQDDAAKVVTLDAFRQKKKED